MTRRAEIERKTKETDISCVLTLDGSGRADIDTGIGFFDHMLDGFTRHGLFDLKLKCSGDLNVDCHHSIEDCGIILPTSAIRDEGTSYHYLPPSDTIEVNRKWRDTFKEVLKECGYPYVEGTTWTTDAVYRETRGEGKPPKGTGCHLRGDGMRRHAGPV